MEQMNSLAQAQAVNMQMTKTLSGSLVMLSKEVDSKLANITAELFRQNTVFRTQLNVLTTNLNHIQEAVHSLQKTTYLFENLLYIVAQLADMHMTSSLLG